MKEIFVYYDLELAIWHSLDYRQNMRNIEHEILSKHQKMLQTTPNFCSICITMPPVIPEM